MSGCLLEGGVLVVAGPSGSGKTTLLRILARLREADSGKVLLDGRLWTEFTPVQWRRRVNYLAQKPAVFDGSVEDNLRRPFELNAVKKELQYDREKALELMERVLLSGSLLNQDARTLSGGETARMALVRALLVEPEALLLDEPLAALDRKSAGAVIELINWWAGAQTGRGLVVVSHVGEFGALPGLSVLELAGEEAGSVE